MTRKKKPGKTLMFSFGRFLRVCKHLVERFQPDGIQTLDDTFRWNPPWVVVCQFDIAPKVTIARLQSSNESSTIVIGLYGGYWTVEMLGWAYPKKVLGLVLFFTNPPPAGCTCGNVFSICAHMSLPRAVLWMAIFSLGRIKAATVYFVVAFLSP